MTIALQCDESGIWQLIHWRKKICVATLRNSFKQKYERILGTPGKKKKDAVDFGRSLKETCVCVCVSVCVCVCVCLCVCLCYIKHIYFLYLKCRQENKLDSYLLHKLSQVINNWCNFTRKNMLFIQIHIILYLLYINCSHKVLLYI